MFGHRSLYHDGWRAVCPWPGTSFTESGLPFGAPIDYDKLIELDAKGWELYNLNEDFAETNNLAEKERDRLIAMIGMWYVEAGKYNVLPIDSRGTLRFAEPAAADRRRPQEVRLLSRHPDGAQQRRAASGQRAALRVGARQRAQGRRRGRAVLHGRQRRRLRRSTCKDGKLTYGYNYVADQRFKVQSNDGGIPEGDHIFSFEFTPTGKPDIAKGKGVPANIKLFVDGKAVGSGDLPVTIPLSLGLAAGVSVGSRCRLTGHATDYKPPFAFTGTVKKALVDVRARRSRTRRRR